MIILWKQNNFVFSKQLTIEQWKPYYIIKSTQEVLRGEIMKKIKKKFMYFFLLQINVIWSHFIFIIDHIKVMSFTCFSAVLGCYFVLLLSSTPTSRKRGLFVMLCSKLWPVLYWIIDPSDKCHRSLFISLAMGSAKRWCNFSVMEQCDKFTPKTCRPWRKNAALKSRRIFRNNSL